MHLISQNILCCRVKGCPSNGQNTLGLTVTATAHTPRPYNVELARKLLKMMDYELIVQLAKHVGVEIPAGKEAAEAASEEILQRLFTLMVETDVTTGQLCCNDCKRVYPVVGGIPNLILDDKEL